MFRRAGPVAGPCAPSPRSYLAVGFPLRSLPRGTGSGAREHGLNGLNGSERIRIGSISKSLNHVIAFWMAGMRRAKDRKPTPQTTSGVSQHYIWSAQLGMLHWMMDWKGPALAIALTIGGPLIWAIAVADDARRRGDSEQRKKAVSSYSGGMRQRFGIAQSLIGSPKLVIVDEPTAGLDPGERNRFYNILSEIGENIIVILSTHIVQDVRELCTQMAVMDRGTVLFSGNTDDALLEVKGKVWEKKVSKLELTAYQDNYKVISNKLVGGQPLIHVFSETDLDGFTRAEENLEDVFFAKLNELV